MDAQALKLKQACTLAALELYGAADDAAGLPPHTFSPGFEQNMRRLIAHVRGNRYRRLTKTAKIVLIAAILLLLATLSVVAARQFGFTLLDFGDHSELEMEKHTAVSDGSLACGYIPEGFTLTETDKIRGSVHQTYENTDSVFFAVDKCSTYGGTLGIDTESRPPREIEKNGINYTIAGSEDVPAILWMDKENNCLYMVSGNISEEELLKIAYAVK